MIEAQAERAISRRVDIAIYDRDGQLQLVVEVKSRLGATDDWVAQMRRNLVAHLDIPHAPFFLLALPDRFYLWRNPPSHSAAVPPDYEIDAAPLLAPYIDDDYRLSSTFSDSGLQLAVAAWLGKIVSSHPERAAAPNQGWLFDSGLYAAISGGTVAS